LPRSPPPSFTFVPLTPPLRSTFHPYTTLFRSIAPEAVRVLALADHRQRRGRLRIRQLQRRAQHRQRLRRLGETLELPGRGQRILVLEDRDGRLLHAFLLRSEEHTSELQSRENLVC